MLARFLLFILITFPVITNCLGFGQIRVFSYLNEPLDAEVELIGTESYDLDKLMVSLASGQDFTKANLPRPYFLTKLRFELARTNTGKITYIKISSRDAIKQPFLDFMLDLSWPTGKMLKAYTILLDPLSAITTRRADTDRFSYVEEDEAPPPIVATYQTTNVVESNKAGLGTGDNTSLDAMEKLFDTAAEVKAELDTQEIVKEVASIPVEQQVANVQLENIEAVPNIAKVAKPKVKTLKPEALVVDKDNDAVALAVNQSKAAAPKPSLDNLKPVVVEISYKMVGTILSSVIIAIVFVVWYVKKKVPVPVVMQKTSVSQGISQMSGLSDSVDKEQFSDEFGMKLQLAKQYIEVGDSSNATEILEDVLKHGDDFEKDEAKLLLATMSLSLS